MVTADVEAASKTLGENVMRLYTGYGGGSYQEDVGENGAQHASLDETDFAIQERNGANLQRKLVFIGGDNI
jgi:hypothetical protein